MVLNWVLETFQAFSWEFHKYLEDFKAAPRALQGRLQSVWRVFSGEFQGSYLRFRGVSKISKRFRGLWVSGAFQDIS